MVIEQCTCCHEDLEESQIGLCGDCQRQDAADEPNVTNHNAKFLSVVDEATKSEILESIATHYGITPAEAYAEVADEEAEHLLEYMVEPQRSATSVLMQRHRV